MLNVTYTAFFVFSHIQTLVMLSAQQCINASERKREKKSKLLFVVLSLLSVKKKKKKNYQKIKNKIERMRFFCMQSAFCFFVK
jgi:uncharacterized protein YhhL (DUF1145 family)